MSKGCPSFDEGQGFDKLSPNGLRDAIVRAKIFTQPESFEGTRLSGQGYLEPRRGLAGAVTAAWLIGVGIGTPVAFMVVWLLRAPPEGALISVILLPLAWPVAFFLSLLAYLPGLLLAISFPRWIIHHRALVFAALPIVVAGGMLWNTGDGFLEFDRPLEATCAVFDACIAAGWAYHFTGHLTDQV